ncbi:MAG: CocE/NonD family hydrolase [Nevskiaceae bacterium]|nr:MAG: CocE/NonD family hydrolase [Nevskiaceae bacterium]
MAALTTLAACGSSTAPSDHVSAPASAAWSTLGTRALPAAASAPITSNAGAQWVDYNPAETYAGQNTTTHTVTMADGTVLSVAVSLPADANGMSAASPLPTIVTFTGYNKNLPGNTPVSGYLGRHGYAEVLVDVRGTGSSGGVWDMFGPIEQADYVPVLDWVVAQPFCNGRIALYGESLLGITAALAASKQHPAVKAAFLKVPMADSYRDIVFTGGQTSIAFIPLWFGLVMAGSALNPQILDEPAAGLQIALTQLLNGVATVEVPLMLKAITGDSNTVYDNDFWAMRSPREQAGNIRVPTFIVGGLQDIFQRGEPLLYETIKRNAPAKLLIGPWTHTTIGSGLPADGVPPFDHIALQWFDQYLRGRDSGASRLPNVTQYVYGLGHYVTSTDWPHPQASAQRLYLHGDKTVNANAPATGEASNVTLQEPVNGLCSASASQWTAGELGKLPLFCFSDDSAVEALDVKYETAPMAQDFYINGPIAVDLWVSTTGNDAGLSARIDDVDGSTVTPLTNGLQTLSLRATDAARSRTLDGQVIQPWHRFTPAAVQGVTSGAPTAVSVEVFPTSALIKAGHKLRVSIGPSDFPHGLPPLPTLVNTAAGVLTIYSDATHPSSVVLPVVPASALK